MRSSIVLLAACLFLVATSVCVAKDPEAGIEIKYPPGYTSPKNLEAPYGRTPGGSAIVPPAPGTIVPKTIYGQPNVQFEYLKPKPFVGIDPNDHDQSYLSYSIPKDAVKGIPFKDRGDDADTIEYFDPVSHDLVARERVLPQSHQVVQQQLFKGRDFSTSERVKRHGIQREWYDDGKPKSEAPYKNGIRHGLFRQWDKEGNLVACYKIINGAGVEKVYYPNGRLKQEVDYRENLENGQNYEMYDNGQMLSVVSSTGGHPSGLGVAYYPNGQISFVGQSDDTGRPNGPIARFSANGRLEGDITYFIHGENVAKEQYLDRTKADPKLPKVENDPQLYKKWVDDRIKKIVAEYRAMPPVKIPLECKDEEDAKR